MIHSNNALNNLSSINNKKFRLYKYITIVNIFAQCSTQHHDEKLYACKKKKHF